VATAVFSLLTTCTSSIANHDMDIVFVEQRLKLPPPIAMLDELTLANT
jgi:hypothetical protein